MVARSESDIIVIDDSDSETDPKDSIEVIAEIKKLTPSNSFTSLAVPPIVSEYQDVHDLIEEDIGLDVASQDISESELIIDDAFSLPPLLSIL